MIAKIRQVEIHRTSGCTLKCNLCQHGSHVLPRVNYVDEDYVPHLLAMREFAAWDSLIIGGGEPFTNPETENIVRECSAVHACEVVLLTNGFWMLRPDWLEFVRPVLRMCQHVVVSRYPVYVSKIGVEEWDRRLVKLHEETGVLVDAFHPHDHDDLRYSGHVHHDVPQPFVGQCALAPCLQLSPFGVLLRCPLGYWRDLIPGVTQSFLRAFDRSGTYALIRRGEGFEAWHNTAQFEACSYCGLATGHSVVEKWKQVDATASPSGAGND
jgi:hypothetical protein